MRCQPARQGFRPNAEELLLVRTSLLLAMHGPPPVTFAFVATGTDQPARLDCRSISRPDLPSAAGGHRGTPAIGGGKCVVEHLTWVDSGPYWQDREARLGVPVGCRLSASRITRSMESRGRHSHRGSYFCTDQPDLIPTRTPPHPAHVSVALRKPMAVPIASVAFPTAAC